MHLKIATATAMMLVGISVSLPEYDPEKAVRWLIDNSDGDAEKRANRLYLEQYRKSLKALIMKEQVGKLSIAAREVEAYADQRYLDHLNVMKEAIRLDEQARFLRHGAEIKLDVWRTAESTKRALKV
jgi:hypothetical protein